jgi:hypothetical protein
MIRVLLTLALSALTALALDIPWNGADRVLRNKIVRVELRSGATIEGLWLNSNPNTFTLDTTKQGQLTNTRADIRRAFLRPQRHRGRVIGTVAGYVAGAGLAGLIGGGPEATQGPLIALPFGLGALGFFTGRSLDRQPEPLNFL